MKTTLSAIAIAVVAAPAFAAGPTPVPAEPIVAAPAPAPLAYDFTGPSVGARLSYGDFSGDFISDDDGDGDGDLDEFDFDGDNVLYGLTANYDYALGRAILGFGVDYDFADIDLGDDSSDDDSPSDSLENILRVKARGGFASGRNMFYLTGGYARASTDNSGDADGYFAGAGYEVFLTQSVTAGAEVLYHEFDDFDGDTGDLDAETTTVGVSLNYRF